MKILIDFERGSRERLRVVHIPGFARSRQTGGLLEAAAVRMGDAEVPLGRLSELMIEGDVARIERELGKGDRASQRIGVHFFEALFGDDAFEPGDAGDGLVDMRILTDDDYLLRLPWHLLSYSGQPLSRRCGISLGGGRPRGHATLPSEPRVVVAMPDPRRDTHAREHLAEIEPLLAAAGVDTAAMPAPARTWEELHHSCREHRPHVLYFYGHGHLDHEESYLVFETSRARKAESGEGEEQISVARLADLLPALEPEPPLLVYLNCCHADGGGLLGAGSQLRGSVRAVVLNRTRVLQGEARRIGSAFLSRCLEAGAPPHVALSEAMRTLRADTGETRWFWMSPVLHASYDDWETEGPRALVRPRHSPDPMLYFCRGEQLEIAEAAAVALAAGREAGVRALLWHGDEDQGIEFFRWQLADAIRERLRADRLGHLEVLPVDWPDDDSPRSLAARYDAALAARRGAGPAPAGWGNQVLLVDHTPIRYRSGPEPSFVTPEYLTQCIEWWRRQVGGRDAPARRVVLSFGHAAARDTRSRPHFSGLLARLAGPAGAAPAAPSSNLAEVIRGLESERDDVDALAQLGPVERDQLATLLAGVPATSARAAEAADEILRSTAGRYDAVLLRIQQLLREEAA